MFLSCVGLSGLERQRRPYSFGCAGVLARQGHDLRPDLLGLFHEMFTACRRAVKTCRTDLDKSVFEHTPDGVVELCPCHGLNLRWARRRNQSLLSCKRHLACCVLIKLLEWIDTGLRWTDAASQNCYGEYHEQVLHKRVANILCGCLNCGIELNQRTRFGLFLLTPTVHDPIAGEA
jgi:hypothetical protein